MKSPADSSKDLFVCPQQVEIRTLFRLLMTTFLSQLFFSTVHAEDIIRDKVIAAQSCVLMIRSDGSVVVSGDVSSVRADGQSTAQSERPRGYFLPVETLCDVKSVRLAPDSEEAAAALDKSGRVWVWGDQWKKRFANEQASTATPQLLDAVSNISAIACGSGHLITLGNDGRVRTISFDPTYGGNDSGQLGSGDAHDHTDVVTIGGIDDAIAVDAGPSTTFILRRDGTVWGCGSGGFGILGPSASQTNVLSYDESENINSRPLPINGLSKIVAIDSGHRFAIALDRKSNVWGWGLNDSGQLGPDDDDLQGKPPRRIPGLTGIKSIAAGYDFVLAVTKEGNVKALGGNVYGTLGDRRGELVGPLRTIAGLKEIESVFAGHYNAFAIDKAGKVWGWGANDPSVGGFDPIKDVDDVVPAIVDLDRRPKPPSKIIEEGGMTIRIRKELEVDEIESDITVELDGKAIGKLSVDENVTTDWLAVDLSSGSHHVTLGGTMRRDGQTTRPVVGESILFFSGQQSPAERFRETLATDGIVVAIRQLQNEVEAIDASLVPSEIQLHSDGPIDEAILAQFEEANDVRLPADYRQFLVDVGPFSLGDQDLPYPQVAVYAPDAKRTVGRWVNRGLAIVGEDTTQDWQLEANDNFAYFKDRLTSAETNPLRSRWQKQLIGAATGLELFIADPSGQPCGDQSTASQWIEFFETDVDEDTGNETYFGWTDEAGCESAFLYRLASAVEASLRYGYADAGIVFIGPTDEHPSAASGALSVDEQAEFDLEDPTPQDVIKIRLTFEAWEK